MVAKSTVNSTQYAELMEKINQLNILRESNATLRAESEAHARRAKQLESSVNQLSAELEPTREKIRTVQAESDEKDRQIRRLEDENKQWKERNSQLLTKVSKLSLLSQFFSGDVYAI